MPRINGQRVLNDPLATRQEISGAIALLQNDIAYMRHAHITFNQQAEFRWAIAESLELIQQLQDKLADNVRREQQGEPPNGQMHSSLI